MEITRYGLKWLEMPRMAGHGWIYLEMAGNDQKWLETAGMAGYGWELLEMFEMEWPY